MKYVVTAVIVFFVVQFSEARTFRVAQIPNGAEFSCMNCHVTAGGPRNEFGKEIEENFLDGDNVVWNAELAALDSDGDGFTNGEELFDPEGTWRIGDDNPEINGEAGNPGQADSEPVSVMENFANKVKELIRLESISPNPLVSKSEFKIDFKYPGNVSIEIYTVNGNKILTVYEGFAPAGTSTFDWNGTNSNSENLPGGMYFLMIRKENSAVVDKIHIIR
jgi:hypothetical protein